MATEELVPPELRYDVDLSTLPDDVATRFVALSADDETQHWLNENARARHGRLATWTHALAVRFFDDFEVNGLFGMHDMFLLGTAQWETLLGGRTGGRLLDVGAGDGHVTARLSPLFDSTVTLETSKSLARRLDRRGYRTHLGELASLTDTGFDVVALLNVLDRVHRPRAMVRDAKMRLANGGRLLVATPLPFEPFVFDGPRTVQPTERLDLDDRSWEAACESLLRRVLEPAGLVLDAFTRAPYLSRGDAEWDLYARDDAVLVLSPAETE